MMQEGYAVSDDFPFLGMRQMQVVRVGGGRGFGFGWFLGVTLLTTSAMIVVAGAGMLLVRNLDVIT